MGVDDGALPGLQRIGFVRSVRTPQFDGITFHEVLCKSALNEVPNASMLPFRVAAPPPAAPAEVLQPTLFWPSSPCCA